MARTVAHDAELEAAIRSAIEGETVLSGFLATAARSLDEEALRWRRDGTWTAMTWRDYRQAVAEVAAGLTAAGFGRRECALILSRNRPEPHVADLAVQAAGGIPVSLHTTHLAEQIAEVANHCEATVIFVEDEFVHVAEQIRGTVPSLRTIVVLGDHARAPEKWAITWDELRAAGAPSAGDPEELLASAAQLIGPDDLATLIYTSGTTGKPRGVMLSQQNIRWVIAAGFHDMPPSTGERFISFLPLATVGGRMVDLWGHVVLGGAVISFCPDPARLFEYAREVRPTLLLAVPAVWEELYRDLTLLIEREPDDGKRATVHRCLQVGRQLARLREAKQEVPAELAAMVERVRPVLTSIRALFGLDQCRAAVSGGAPIDAEVIQFFQALGLPMTASWGMTELTSAVTSGGPTGSVGTGYSGVEVSLAADGEVLVRGGLVMKGYYRDPEATAEAIDAEGWLHTGDLGSVDEEGNLRIVGRKKDIIVTAVGTNVAPMPIELRLQRHPLVAQACVVGDRRNHLAALLTLDREMVAHWAEQHGVDGSDAASFVRAEAVLADIQRTVDEVNSTLPVPERIHRFALLPDVWTIERGELTPTFKKRRSQILEQHAADIDALYA
jgi:long-subunit acyl-CoA synthetase (AMP-forming)